jgi:hypothetical protein
VKNKALFASAAALVLLSAFLFAPVRQVAAAVAYSGMSIFDSVINSTTIGMTIPAAGTFTTLDATSVSANTVVSNSASVNGQPAAFAGLNGFTAYGRNGTGDMDFIAANNGASPSFCWYFLLGTTADEEMCLNQAAQLSVAGGIASNVTGNLTGNGTGTWNGPVIGNVTGNLTGNVAGNATTATTAASTTGNSASASAFNHTPTQCANGGVTGIAANGNANCSSTFKIEPLVVTGGFCTTGGAAFNQCPFAVTWPSAFADSGYAVTCNAGPGVEVSGTTALTGVFVGSLTATGFTVTIQNGDGAQADPVTISFLSCIGIHP